MLVHNKAFVHCWRTKTLSIVQFGIMISCSQSVSEMMIAVAGFHI